ncbi:hypothetical protein [Methanogenium sp. MK-MG]|uniref:hypothetical protein n=1 Tax=Methanogenium sp. MK-MG TaxID=2599926 RepID=UPI0013EB516C|nr:hypothetical protein [Methanogenium sp. MK-MG]
MIAGRAFSTDFSRSDPKQFFPNEGKPSEISEDVEKQCALGNLLMIIGETPS